MAYSLRILVVLVLAMLAVVSCMPSGFGGGKHEHIVVHVPYNVHHVHHYHKVPVHIHHKEVVHYSHHDHHDHHDSHGWDWD